MALSSAYTGTYELEFERPLIALEKQITDLEAQADPNRSAIGLDPNIDFGADLRKLRQSHTAMLKKIYRSLNAWNTVRVARHPGRPQSIDHIKHFVKDFTEIHGDRRFGDDAAMLTGFGRIGPHKCLVVGHHKGKDTADKIKANFGCAHPEGYRKALRAMKLAEKFNLPIVTLVDTPGAYPGVGAEERGQSEAIALNLREMARLKTPIVSVVIGEGGSGGALGIGVADRLSMMQYAWYSVISPEGCAAILWKAATPETNAEAAEALKLTAKDNQKLGIIDDIIEEPLGGAHRRPNAASDRLEDYLIKALRDLKRFKPENLVDRRYDRLRRIGEVSEPAPA
ncbi:MAG: acetyl-CoA carboxylase carboxyltransferase subunit alpha [Planctomycetota bacterium]